jgi:hypothetical protein
MKHAAIGAVAMEFNSFAELFEKATLLSQMPESCDKCGSEVVLLFKNITAGQGPRKGTKMKYYGLQCTGEVRHEYYLGIHNDDSRELFAYAGRGFQDPYTNEQLENAEYREVCPHCKSTNQFHAKDCPNYNAPQSPDVARTEPEPEKVDNSASKPVSTPSEAPAAKQTQSASQAERTPVQRSRDRFVRAVGELGLSLGNTELGKMLISMHGWKSVPSPITPEHWDFCYNLCNEYKTAVEIGGLVLDKETLEIMLRSTAPGSTAQIQEFDAGAWRAAAERAMGG